MGPDYHILQKILHKGRFFFYQVWYILAPS